MLFNRIFHENQVQFPLQYFTIALYLKRGKGYEKLQNFQSVVKFTGNRVDSWYFVLDMDLFVLVPYDYD